MGAIKDGRVSVMLDCERHMVFSLNVLEVVQDKVGSLENMGEHLAKGEVRFLKWLCTLLINEGLPEGSEPLTEVQVGKMITVHNLQSVNAAIMSAFRMSTTGDADALPDDDAQADDPTMADEASQ